MKNRFYFLFAMILFACDQTQQIQDPWLPEGFRYAYSITEYDEYPDNKEQFNSREYYDAIGKILLRAGPEEGCFSFHYDSTGKLLEKRWGRTCTGGRRDSMVYDLGGNLIGSVLPKDSLHPNPPPFRQTKFYDKENRLIKEFIREFTDGDRNKYVYWRELWYDKGKISKEKITMNEGLEWDCFYEYNMHGQLVAINRNRLSICEKETFKYDAQGRLKEKRISSNEYPLTPEVIFSAANNRTLYEYDSTGFLVKTTVVSHRGKKESISYFTRRNNKP